MTEDDGGLLGCDLRARFRYVLLCVVLSVLIGAPASAHDARIHEKLEISSGCRGSPFEILTRKIGDFSPVCGVIKTGRGQGR